MQINKPHTAAYYSIVGIQALITIFLIAFFSRLLVHLYFLHWLVLLVLLFTLFLPQSKKPLLSPSSSAKKILEPSRWLFKIVFLQVSLLLTYLGICECVGQVMPVLTKPNNQLFIMSLQQQLIHWGLFPWAIIIILATGFAHVAYHQQKHALLSDLIDPIFPTKTQSLLWVIYNTSAKEPGAFAFACSFAIFSILLASLISTKFALPHSFTIAALFIGLPVALFSATRFFKQFCNRVFSHRFHAPIIMIFITILSGFVLFILNSFFHSLSKWAVVMPSIFAYLNHQPWTYFWNIFAASWWIGWSVFSAIYIAHISYGKSLRQISAATLLLPLIITLVMLLFERIYTNVGNHSLSILWSLLGLLGWCCLMSIFMKKSMITSIALSYLPKQGLYKTRGYSFFSRRVLQFGFILLFFYFPLGILSFVFFGFGLTLPLIILLCLIIPVFVNRQQPRR